MVRLFIIILSITCSLSVSSQTDLPQQFGALEGRVEELFIQLRNQKDDDSLNKYNALFKSEFKEILRMEQGFDHPFRNLNSIGKINSQDDQVRVITWNVQWTDGTHSYFGFVLKRDKRKASHHVSELTQYPKGIYPKYNKEQLEPSQWYGCLYYDIVDVQKGNKTYYTLLGYDAYDTRSKIKILDIMFFAANTPRFGYPMFQTDKGYEKRIFMEHSAKATMSLKYDKKRQLIIFDHLSPEAPNLAEFREYYVPDMSYDAYKYENGKWLLSEDIIAINPEENRSKVLVYDPKTDTSVVIQENAKWIDPTNRNAPIDGGTHRAVKPVDELSPKEKNAKVKKKQKDKGFSGVKYSTLPEDEKKKK